MMSPPYVGMVDVVFYADPPFDDIKVLGWRREEHFPMVGMNIAMKRKVPKHG
jgi:hypothetical protein